MILWVEKILYFFFFSAPFFFPPPIRLIQYARFKSQHSDVVPDAADARSKLAIHTVQVVAAVSMLFESTPSLAIIASCSCTLLSTEILIEYLILEKMNENSDDDKKKLLYLFPQGWHKK